MITLKSVILKSWLSMGSMEVLFINCITIQTNRFEKCYISETYETYRDFVFYKKSYKSDGQANIYKYRVTSHLIIQNICSLK